VAASAPVQDPGGALRAVVEAVTARDTAGAVMAYEGLASSDRSGLAPEQHLFVGRAAASSGDFNLAAKAFESAADVAPDSPVAPQALVLLARLCDERMRNPERAQSVYRYIVHRYPDTDASRFAAKRLPPEA
jgi:TolA-binding protein